jgi:hypothetical protein
MSKTINKHGLSRDIPAHIRATIRKTDGYGCVNCGNIFIQYEHIDPLFCDAEEHDPDNMTLLCSGCHDESTGRRLPKRIIRLKKQNPYCKQMGYAKSRPFHPNPNEMKIIVGNSTFSNTEIALSMHGKPLIWVTKDYGNVESPLLYNAIFMDSNGNKIGYLSKNQFIGLIDECDFQATSSRIEVRSKKGEINLIIEIIGDQTTEIKRLFFKYYKNTVRVGNDGIISISEDNNTITIRGINTNYCLGGLKIYDPIYCDIRYNNIFIAIALGSPVKIKNIFGKHLGYIFSDYIIGLDFKILGSIHKSKVYTFLGEYIGDLLFISNSDANIIMEKDEYPDQEPIWISERNRFLFLFQSKLTIDTSYRLFGLSSVNQ